MCCITFTSLFLLLIRVTLGSAPSAEEGETEIELAKWAKALDSPVDVDMEHLTSCIDCKVCKSTFPLRHGSTDLFMSRPLTLCLSPRCNRLQVICVTGEDTPDADVIVRILLRCQLPMPLTLTNVTPVLHADGAEADVTFAPSTKVALMPHSTKVVDINVRGQGRALGAVLEITGVTANAGKNCKLRWYVLRSMEGSAHEGCVKKGTYSHLPGALRLKLRRLLYAH